MFHVVNELNRFAMVEFLDPKSIAAALKLDGTELDGREVVIQQRSDNRGTKPVKGSTNLLCVLMLLM